MKPFLWIIILVASASLAEQSVNAAAPTHTFDLVSYTPPKGFNVVEKKEANGSRVELTKSSPTSYCVITIYSSRPSGDLEASFATQWEFVARQSTTAVNAAKPTLRIVGNARAVAGSATVTFAGGQPVWLMQIVLDAVARVQTIIVMTPNEDEFKVYREDVEQMLGGLVVKRVKETENPPAVAASAAPRTDERGKLIIPAPTRAITVADLVGEWGQNDGITTTYVNRYTGTYAGFESLHFSNKWTITKEGEIYNDFFAIQNGKKITEETAGTVSVTGPVLAIKRKGTAKYVVRGWLETPEMTIMTLCGAWYDDDVIPQAIFTNPEQGWNLNKNWVRKKK